MNVLLTGYWPPTNEMLRQWSPSPRQNRGGWRGGNWGGYGFDVHAHFPEFPPGTGPGTDAPWGEGELEVDYAKTTADLARLTAALRPAGIVTFSRGRAGSNWEIEPACQRHRLPGESEVPGRNVPLYATDRRSPGFPLGVEAMADPPGTFYLSTQPAAAIIERVTSATEGRVHAFVPKFAPQSPDADGYDFGGNYLSGFIGLLGTRHQAQTPGCHIAGHIHVGRDTPLADATLAAEATLHAVLEALRARLSLA